GLPTRLMDWTTNPLTALWFAVKDTPKDNDSYAVVWIYKPREDQNDDAYRTRHVHHPFETPITLYLKPMLVDQRLVVQNSIFTLHGSGENNADKKFIPIELDEKMDRLKKIIIPGPIQQSLSDKLQLCGIDESAMFPGLEGLCRQISKKYGRVPI
ncbi:MAG: FRG domain-containing protein, partial [Deltaproteobacteria bacterium]|nr:FRG domain-containing protein [Deltaproteobacteria bacterium]